MIPLVRTRDAASIPEAFHGAGHVGKCAELLTRQRRILRNEVEKHDFKSGVWSPAKELLLKESHEKCAYCESSVTTTGFGDVEHYRPKSKYWWLAYSLENYLASCAICNQKFKKDKFPLLPGGARFPEPLIRPDSPDAELLTLATTTAPDPLLNNALLGFRVLHQAERPALINPYVDDPSTIFGWQEDDVLKEVSVIPLAGVVDAEAYVKAAEDVYGINRSQLRRDRYFFFRHYRFVRLTILSPQASDALKQDARAEIDFMLGANHPYAGMLRYFAARDGLP